MGLLGRRAFLVVVTLLSPLVRRAAAQGQAAGAPLSASVSLDDFLTLSSQLTGRTGLDPEIARIYLDALLSTPARVPLLGQMSARTRAGVKRTEPTPAEAALEREIIAAWYTGTYTRDGQQHLATHAGALMWNAIGQPAPGTCTGRTGAWSQPPLIVAR